MNMEWTSLQEDDWGMVCLLTQTSRANWTLLTDGSQTGMTLGEAGKTTYYYTMIDRFFTNSNAGGSGLTILGTVYLYIPSGKTITCTGAHASGTTGGGAGIELTAGNTLYLLGSGTVNATGGNAANGGNGAGGGHATYGDEWVRSGDGGRGGDGGGGAGAGIGTRGGTGGAGGAGGAGKQENDKRQQAMLAAMVPRAVLLPRWVHSTFTTLPRHSPPRRIFAEAIMVQMAAPVALEVSTFYVVRRLI
jgi:hypothetical protein